MVELLAAKVWLCWTYAAFTSYFPFLSVYYRTVCGFSASQIGVLLALRPWCVAATGSAWAALADWTQAYKTILLAAYAASTVFRSGILFTNNYLAVAAIVVLSEVNGAPIGIISDAAIVAASKKDEDYGKTRMWGAVGWGAFSPVAGALMTRYGMRAGFSVGLVMAALGFLPTFGLPWEPLYRRGAVGGGGAPVGGGEAPASKPAPDEAPPGGPRGAAPAEAEAAAAEAGAGKAVGAGEVGTRLRVQADGVGGQEEGRFAFAAGPASPHAERQQLVVGGEGEREAGAGAGSTADAEARQLLGEPGGSRAVTTPAHRKAERRRSHEESFAAHAPIAPAPELLGGPPGVGAGAGAPSGKEDGGGAGGLDEPLLASEDRPASPRQGFGARLRRILATPGVLPFCATSLIMGFGMGAIDGYLFIYLNELGASETLMGVTITVTTLAEIPVFYYTGALLRALGVAGMLHLVQAAFVVRLLAYAALPWAGSPWAVVPVEALHGLTFGGAWSAGCVHAQRLAPPGQGATMQALFQGLYQGAGLGLGGLVGGLIYNPFGGRVMFLAVAAFLALSWGLSALAAAPLWGRRPLGAQGEAEEPHGATAGV